MTCSKHGETRYAYEIFVGKRAVKRPRGRPKRKWKDNNNKINVKKVGYEGGVDWIQLPQCRVQ